MIRSLLLPVLLACLTLNARAAVLPDTLTVTNVDVTGDGLNDTILLTKRSVRAANFRLWTWTVAGGYVQVTNVPPVSTFRGHVQSDPSLRVNGFVNYLGKLSLNVTEGRNNTVARPENVDVDLGGPPGTADPGTGNVVIPLMTNRVSPTTQGFLIPRTHMRKLRVGVDTTGQYCANSRYGGDIALMLAAAEQRFNDTDMFYARDMGLAWELTDFVLRLDGDPANWKSFWGGSDGITPLPFNEKIRLDGDTGGVSVGRVFSATVDFPNTHSVTTGGPDKWESASIGHETGHGLAVGHYSSYNDTMSGSESALGAGTVQRMIEQMHLASEVSAPAVTYGSPLAPYAMEDYANTMQNQPVNINVLANDYDGNGDALTLSYVDLVTDAGGTVTNLGGGVVRYTPPAGHLGVDRFRYHVADPGGIENRTGVVKVYTRNSGLANHWLFDATGGATVWDVGPYQNHGTVESGVTSITAGSVPGRIGNAYQNLVNASNDGITCDSGDPLDGDLSVSLWVKFSSVPTVDRTIICKGGAVISGRIDAIRGGWAVSVVGGKFYFACKKESDLELSDLAADLQGTASIATNQWYHLAMAMDRTNHVLRAWINGVTVTSSPSGNTTIPNGFIENYYPLRILNCSHDDASTVAAVDDVRIYNQVLSGAEVTALYAANDEIAAGAPSPRNGESAASALNVLKWIPGRPTGYVFDVFFGTNQAAIIGATTNSAPYLGRTGTNTSAPALDVSTTYYWRVDEVTTNGVVVAGPVWTFTTKATLDYLFDNGGGNGVWDNALNWNPDGAPTATRDYFVTGNYTVLSPGALEDVTPKTYAFGGRSLTVNSGATLNLMKLNSSGTDTVTVNITNLTISDATLTVESGRNYDLSLNTSLHLEGDNDLFMADGSFQRWFRLKGGMTGSGTFRVYRNDSGSTREVHLTSGSFGGYSGDWRVESASGTGSPLEVFCEAPSGWGTGNMTLGTLGSLILSTNVEAPNSTLKLSASSLATIAAARTLRLAGLEGAGGTVTNNAGATLEVGADDSDHSFSGVIAGAGRLVKTGSGILTLTGANTYTGTTTISGADGGALLVNGSLAATAVTVESGNTLGGTGTIGGVLTVLADATLAPGTSIGTLTLSQSPVLNGAVRMEINRSALPNADKLVRSGGSLTFGGTLIITNIGAPLQVNDTFDLFDATGFSGLFTLVSQTPEQTVVWDVSNLAVNGTVRVAAFPPATPPPLTWFYSGNALQLAWPSEYLSWIAQSNAVGIASPGSWFDIPGSGGATNLNIPINPAVPQGFYRLRSP